MYEYKIVSVKKIVDGDTLDCTLDLGFGIFCIQRIRLHGIDAPETHSKDIKEKSMGKESQEFLASWLEKHMGKLVIKTFKDDKYGRLLGIISGANGEIVNESMVKLGYAWSYDGRTKVKELSHLEKLRKSAGS
jgi:micrococcal nuclease